MSSSMRMRQVPLLPDRSLLTVDIEDIHTDAKMQQWWDKAKELYDKLTPKQKEYVDERWAAHKGRNHPVFYTYYCSSAKHSIPPK